MAKEALLKSAHFATVLFSVPVKGSKTMISRHNIPSWRELRDIGFLKNLESNSNGVLS